MVDIHSHILPGIDDGAKTIEETIEMLKNAEEKGTKDIVATPHYCIGYGEEPYLKVKERVEKLNKLLKDKKININIHYGQEVYFSTRLLEDLKEGIIGTINGGRYMLLEFSMTDLDEDIFDVLYELTLKGITPIVAHPERYLYIQEEPTLINRFINEGCIFQLNGGSIRGLHGKKAKSISEFFIKKGIYSIIGSDAHNNKNRKTGLNKALEVIDTVKKGQKEKIIENGKKILLNEEIEFNGEMVERGKKKKGFLSFFKP